MTPTNQQLKTRDTILLIFVGVTTFLWNNGFGLRIFDLSDRLEILNLAGLFLIVGAASLRMLFVSLETYFQNLYFRIILGILAAVLFPTFVNLVILKGLSPIEMFRSGLGYCGLFIFIVLVSYRASSSFVGKLNTMVFTICTANVLFLIAMSLLPALGEELLGRASVRFGRDRLSLGGGLGVMVQYSFCYALVVCGIGRQNIRRWAFDLLLFGAYLWYFIVISMGRRTIFTLLIVVCYYVLCHLDATRKVRALLVGLFFLPSLFLFLPQSAVLLDTIQLSYTSSVANYKSDDDTLGVRYDGIRYYLQELHNTGYIGMGLPSSRLSEDDPFLRGRREYHFNPGDHGIFAVLCQFGVVGILLTLLFLFIMFRDLSIIQRRGSPRHQAIAMAIHLYLVFCIVGLLQIFWKPMMTFWTGLMFFMVWRMKEGITSNTLVLREKEASARRAGAKEARIAP